MAEERRVTLARAIERLEDSKAGPVEMLDAVHECAGGERVHVVIDLLEESVPPRVCIADLEVEGADVDAAMAELAKRLSSRLRSVNASAKDDASVPDLAKAIRVVEGRA